MTMRDWNQMITRICIYRVMREIMAAINVRGMFLFQTKYLNIDWYSAPWFKQPKYVPDWLYKYFGATIRPLISAKLGRLLVSPSCFKDIGPLSPASFWIHPPEPSIVLYNRRFNPILLCQPRIFLWLPHFFVEKLYCPKCGINTVLEKNGALAPRRIVDGRKCTYS